MIILIPCYQPDERLLALIDELRAPDPSQRIVLVDDGSGPRYRHVFDAARGAGCDVIGYNRNRGKGHALKKGFAYIARLFPGEDVVCADCDGQHTPADIRRVASVLSEHPDSIVLGARRFVGNVPARSRYGNAVTGAVFSRLTGQRLHDTQTGLRGYPSTMLPWLLGLRGSRYEYELEILLAAQEDELPVVEVPIATVYIDRNRSSHMNLPWDPLRIYTRFLKFSASALSAVVLDGALFLLFMFLTGSLLFSVVGARVASASANYALSGRLVLLGASSSSSGRHAHHATLLAGVTLAASYTVLRLLRWLAVPLLVAKVVAECVLFLAGWRTVRRHAAHARRTVPAAPPAHAMASAGAAASVR